MLSDQLNKYSVENSSDDNILNNLISERPGHSKDDSDSEDNRPLSTFKSAKRQKLSSVKCEKIKLNLRKKDITSAFLKWQPIC